MESSVKKRGPVNVPVVMQMEALECGAASLAMVLAYYKKWIPLEQVRQDMGVSRDGASAKNILLTAQSYGLKGSGYRTEIEGLQEMGSFPCIVHWNFNHFVVLCGFRGNYAYLNDPAKGKIKVPMEEFDRSFTGICLCFSPGEDFVPSGKRKSTIAFARERLFGATAAVVFVLLATIIGNLFQVINPVFSRFFMDRLLTGENKDLLWPFLLLLFFFGMLQVTVASLQAIYSRKLSGKMDLVGSSTFFWKVLRLPMGFFPQRLAGDILVRQVTNSSIAATLINSLVPLQLNVFMMVFYIFVMLRYSPLLTMVGLFAIVCNLCVTKYIGNERENLTRLQRRDEGKLYATTVSGIQMVETIKSSGAENGFFEKWSGYQASANAGGIKAVKLKEYLGTLPTMVASLANATVLVIGVGLCLKGRFTIGMILTFQGFMSSLMAPALSFMKAGEAFQEMRADMERVDDVMHYPEEQVFRESPISEEEDYRKLSGSLEVKNVTFGYSKFGRPIVKDFSMSLTPGKMVAIVGGSGCGKSTMAKLISGLYLPWSGEILFDGKPLSEIERSVFTGSVAVVDQDIILFEDTIAANIKMWNTSIEDFEMILAARDAQIYDDIMARDGGFYGKLMEGGWDLSGGQRQRLEIARVLAQDPAILIMDEATSALDAMTEYEVVKAVKARGIACICIAHRLSTIRDCDEIIVLDHGEVVERGTHEELYAKGGIYANLILNE